MRFGVYVPNFGESSYARTLAELAHDAEESGWDGFFIWDHIMHNKNQRFPMVDSFTALAAMAMTTKRIKIGTTVTPLARRRPWIVARQTASIDHLSNGRLILGVGLGYPPDAEFEMFGEDSDDKIRAARLDEGLNILAGLWRGKPFSHQGRQYQIQKTAFLPRPKQVPRIPVWVGGFWPNKAPFRRAGKWDGVIPLRLGSPMRPTPRDVRDIIAYIKKHRTTTAPFDIATIGWGTGKDRTRNAKRITPYAEAGATWWLESLYLLRDSPREMRTRIRQGPPRT